MRAGGNLGIVFFIIIFCVIVVAHELGHFILAKRNGIRVLEFSIGMGPCLVQFQRNNTKYAIRLFPIGGACIFEGEDTIGETAKKAASSESDLAEEQKEMSAKKETEAKEQGADFVVDTPLGKQEGSFQSAPVAARIATVLAGPMFSFLLAFILAIFLVSRVGSDMPVITNVSQNSAAKEAGLEVGDVITSLDGKTIHLYREISIFSMLNEGESIKIGYERDGKTYETTLKPKYSEDDKRYYMGVVGGERKKHSLLGVLQYSVYEVKYYVDSTLQSLLMLVSGKVKKDDVAGPVGMAQAVGTIYENSKPDGYYYIILNMINFTILLSANLGVLNLLPIPALDGGRLVFLIIEAIRKKPVPPEREGIVHVIGFVVLLLLMLVVLFNDISRIIK